VDPEIDGVRSIDLVVFSDDRGSFAEVYRQTWLPSERSALQGNISRSSAGVLRGMHFHRLQWDYWFVVTGRAFVALADLRRGSPTEGRIATTRLSWDEPRGLFIPPGVAHGFLAETELVLGYLIDRYFDGSDEFGVAWNDPDLAIAWPTPDPDLSGRDRGNPPLAAVLETPPPYRSVG
jgi:dTDP-4-dehydrorhamnose 3,5-epimerase